MVRINKTQAGQLNKFIKGVAILLIVSHHFARSAWMSRGLATPELLQWNYLPLGIDYETLLSNIGDGLIWETLLRLMAHFGYVGVHLFVFASGLGLALGTPKNVDFGTFIRRRMKKIVPPFWIAIGFFVLASAIAGHSYPYLDILERLFLITTFDERKFFVIDSPTWCLAVFLQLYILFPIVRKTVIRYGPASIVALAFIAYDARGLASLDVFTEWNKYFGHTFGLNWIAVFGIGIWLGNKLGDEQEVHSPTAYLATAIALSTVIAWMASRHELVYPIHDTAIGLLMGGGTILIWSKIARGRFAQIVCMIGAISFPLFLYHRPIVTAFAKGWVERNPGQLLPPYLYLALMTGLIALFMLTRKALAGYPRLATVTLGYEHR